MTRSTNGTASLPASTTAPRRHADPARGPAGPEQRRPVAGGDTSNAPAARALGPRRVACGEVLADRGRPGDRLGDQALGLGGVAEVADPHPLPLLEVLVVLEEVLDLRQPLGRDVVRLAPVLVDGKDLVPDPMSIGESDSSTDAVSASKNEVITLNGQRGSAYIYDGGSLKGSGTVTGNVNIATGGVIAPGESPGCFNIGGNLTMTGTYEFEIEGEEACDDYDQIIVAGGVSVAGATLDLARLSSYLPELNSEYILVQNDGSNAVTGEFDGWAQGAQVVVDQVTYEIDYAGGDGNDVVLTIVAIDSALAAEADTPDTGLQSVLANPMIGVATLVISAGTLVLLKRKQLI